MNGWLHRFETRCTLFSHSIGTVFVACTHFVSIITLTCPSSLGSSHCGSSIFVIVCLCPDGDSGDLPVWSSCCGFDRNSFVDISSIHRGPDRSKGERWQTQKKKKWVAGQGRMEELLTSPVTLMTARSGVVVYARRRTFGQDRGVAGTRQTFRQCCKTNTCKLYQPRVVEAGRNLHRQVRVTRKC